MSTPPRLPGSLAANPRLSRWIRIHPEGHVTLRPGKVEIGQGILTALAQIAADELDVAPNRLRLVPASAPSSPDEGVTSGSRSIQDSGMAIRHVCAAVRGLYLSVAAQRTGVPIEAIRIEDGRFLGPAGEIGSYWAQADDALLEIDAPLSARPKPPGARRLAGTAAPRIDLADKLSGAPRFIQDLRLPGLRFARILRPPSRGARLLSVPEAPAGVTLARDGDFLAVICAEEWAANAAAARLAAKLRWEERDSLPEQALLPAAMRAMPHETTIILDRPDDAGGATVRHLRRSFFRPYTAHASIGTVCALARWQDGRLEVWSQSQSIYGLRRDLALTLRIAQDDVVVHHREGAGCYGHNGADDVALDAALAARAVPGTPVRVQWSREEELGWAPFSAAMLVDVAVGTDAEGRITQWRQEVTGNGHLGRPGFAPAPSLLAATQIEDPFPMPLAGNPPHAGGGGADRNAVPIYATGATHVAVHRLLEMPIRVSSFRALGANANVLAIESVMEELAAAAGRDGVAYRLEHLRDPRARAVLQEAAAMCGWPGGPRPEGRGLGIALARYKEIGAWCAVAAEIDAAETVRVRRLWIAADIGEVINPEGAAHQIEGGAVQACSLALKEEVRFDRRGITSASWEAYPILRFSEVPEVAVRLLPRPELPPMGAGECSTGPTIAAIANAITDALGVRPRRMPFTPENIAAAMEDEAPHA
ncbi:MAG TPA: molybdopterin cofactor-binding domain-containing protein [Roseomonas sp.]|jgi:CO/xanthine dehydrogenase Mo-binding subunit